MLVLQQGFEPCRPRFDPWTPSHACEVYKAKTPPSYGGERGSIPRAGSHRTGCIIRSTYQASRQGDDGWLLPIVERGSIPRPGAQARQGERHVRSGVLPKDGVRMVRDLLHGGDRPGQARSSHRVPAHGIGVRAELAAELRQSAVHGRHGVRVRLPAVALAPSVGETPAFRGGARKSNPACTRSPTEEAAGLEPVRWGFESLRVYS